MYIVAFFITYRLFLFQFNRTGTPIQRDNVLNFFISGFIGALLGARIFYCLIYDTSGRCLTHPWLIFWPFDQAWTFVGLAGMSYHGGVIGGTAGALAYGIKKRVDLLLWGDMILAAFPLGYMFGRLGNFINGELYGRVSTAWWAVLFPDAGKLSVHEHWVQDVMQSAGIAASGAMVNLPRHPSQLYEAAGEGLLLWLILWFIVRKKKPFKGAVISAYLAGYGSIRFIIEYFRTPDAGMDFPVMFSPVTTTSHLVISPVNFTTGQILCALMILAGTASWFFFRHLHTREQIRIQSTVP
jgi:phosphatidylglycerol:prolipoprotein diacylglycerol transferase